MQSTKYSSSTFSASVWSHRGAQTIPMKVNPAAEPLYIVNPLASHARGQGGMSKLFSTHPPMEERVARLRQMAGAGASQRIMSF